MVCSRLSRYTLGGPWETPEVYCRLHPCATSHIELGDGYGDDDAAWVLPLQVGKNYNGTHVSHCAPGLDLTCDRVRLGLRLWVGSDASCGSQLGF